MTRYTNQKKTLLEMFTDRTAGESTSDNRLITRETADGGVELIAYGWIKVAEYDESDGAVTVFTGHQALRSTTVSRYLNEVATVANERGRAVVMSGESPTVDSPNLGTRYINDYVSFSGDRSPVERRAVSRVVDSLAHLG